MSPSKRFKPVQRVAQSREQKAAKALGRAQQEVSVQEARLEELKRYHKEYLDRFQRSTEMGISVSQLHEYRAFLAKLERAIQEQEQIVSASQRSRSSQQAQWQQKHLRSQVLEKVVARYEDEGRRTMESRDQKESDDRAQRGDASNPGGRFPETR
ncbi:MAG: flagellar export protein FliJ [Gammaproteobacteria bacterium]|nr:flagellar export protein FliJ [Gammaproteobacteria bacterium]